MKIGWSAGAYVRTFEELGRQADRAVKEGLRKFWISQLAGPDSLTAIAALGVQRPELHFGTAITPTYSRHPVALAAQAITVQSALGARLSLGIGPSHASVVQQFFGAAWDPPAKHAEEYLAILSPLLRGDSVDFQGQHYSASAKLSVEGPAPRLLLAALGPKMLALAGKHTDGTTTWMTGPKTLRTHIVPRLQEAAASAGRPSPVVVAGFPVCLSEDPSAVRSFAAKQLSFYAQLPSYRRMLEMEGVSEPSEIIITGGEDRFVESLCELAESGVTEVRLGIVGRDEAEVDRTASFLGSIGRGEVSGLEFWANP